MVVFGYGFKMVSTGFQTPAHSRKSPHTSDTSRLKQLSLWPQAISSLLYTYFSLFYSHLVAQARNLGITLDSSLRPPPASSRPPCPLGVFSPSSSPPPLPSSSPASLRPGLCQVPLLWTGLSSLHTAPAGSLWEADHIHLTLC